MPAPIYDVEPSYACHFTLSPTVGKIAVFLDTDGNVSDLVTLANINGAANFVFISDLDTGNNNLVAPPANVTLTTATEPTPVGATSATGAKLQFTFYQRYKHSRKHRSE